MAVRSSFTAGEVLTAADLTDTFAAKVDYATPTNAQSGTGASAYTFVLADAQRLTTATGTSAKTFTIPPQSSVVWVANSIIRVANYGAGALTIAGGSGVTVTNATRTLAPYESAALVRTGSNTWTLLPFGGGGLSDAVITSPAATGSYTDSGITYNYYTFTAAGSLVVGTAGLADLMVVGGGAGGAEGGGYAAGGGGGGVRYGKFELAATTYTVTIGGGGAVNTNANDTSLGSLLMCGGGGRGLASATNVGNFGHNQAGGGGSGGGTSINLAGSNYTGGGAGGTLYGVNAASGITLAYNNTNTEYGRGGFNGAGAGAANTGNAGHGNNAGGSGIVIVRVKT